MVSSLRLAHSAVHSDRDSKTRVISPRPSILGSRNSELGPPSFSGTENDVIGKFMRNGRETAAAEIATGLEPC